MMRVLLLIAMIVSIASAQCDCDAFSISTEDPPLLPDYFNCREKNGTCAPAQNEHHYCTRIPFGDVCNDALPDHDKMSAELRFGGRRFTGVANHYGVIYFREGENLCATVDDDSCPSSFIYTAPKGSIQFGCHERDGVLYDSYIDPVKLNEFFNTMRLE